MGLYPQKKKSIPSVTLCFYVHLSVLNDRYFCHKVIQAIALYVKNLAEFARVFKKGQEGATRFQPSFWRHRRRHPAALPEQAHVKAAGEI